MKKLQKILFTVIAGLFVAGIASASLGEYWSTISHLIPRTDVAVDIGSAIKRVREIWTDKFYGDYWISSTGNSMNVQPTGDTDDFFSFKTPADRPTIKREGGKYIYIESSNVNDVGISFRKDADHSGTVNYYKDTEEFGLTSKDPLIFKVCEDYDDYVKICAADNVPELSTVGAADFKINAGGSNDLLLNHSGGNVGIGTINPATALEVNGAITVPTLIGGTATTSDLTLQTTSGVGTTGADMHFLVGNAGGTEAMTILNNGNVGIGTDAPSELLQVGATDTNSKILIPFNAVNTETTGDVRSTIRFSELNETGVDAGEVWNWQVGTVAQTSDWGGNFAILRSTRSGVTDNVDLLVDKEGNVGIGTTSPGTLLQLEKDGDAYLTLKNATDENTDGGAETRIIFEDHENAALAQIQGSHDGTGADTKGDLIFSTHSGSALDEAMRIDSEGNVGIGTASPTSLLHINETPAEAAATPTLSFGDGDTGFYEAADDNLYVSIAGTRRFGFISNAFRGITYGGLTLLDITPTATVPGLTTAYNDLNTGIGSAGADQLSLIAGGVEGIRINTAASGVNYLDITPSATTNAVRIATAGTDTNIDLALMPKGTGNVGIGTVSPDTPLHIYDASTTSDFYIESGGAGLGGRIIIEDTDGAGCTALTTLNGVLTAAVITCP